MDTSLLHKVEITDIIVETATTKTFVLKPLHGWNPEYQPGQFLTLLFYNTGVEKGGPSHSFHIPVRNRC